MRLAACISSQRRSRRALASASSPHWLICQSSSTWAAAHACIRSQVTASMSQREQGRAHQRGHDVQGRQIEGSMRLDRASDAGCRRHGLDGWHDAVSDMERRAQHLARPCKNRVPRLRLAADQFGRPSRPVAEEVAAGILDDVRPHLRLPPHDAIDGGIGEPRERHGRRVDAVGLSLPLGGNGIGQRARRQQELLLGRCPHRLAVEEKAECLADSPPPCGEGLGVGGTLRPMFWKPPLPVPPPRGGGTTATTVTAL